jgi:hypothetical protein
MRSPIGNEQGLEEDNDAGNAPAHIPPRNSTMSMTRRHLTRAAAICAAAVLGVNSLTVSAQTAPFEETTTGVRCHYSLKNDPMGAKTAFCRGRLHPARLLV